MELYCLDLGKKLLFAWVGAWSLSNKSFSSVTAYLVYWVIVTNTVVVFHNHIYIYIYIYIYISNKHESGDNIAIYIYIFRVVEALSLRFWKKQLNPFINYI